MYITVYIIIIIIIRCSRRIDNATDYTIIVVKKVTESYFNLVFDCRCRTMPLEFRAGTVHRTG